VGPGGVVAPAEEGAQKPRGFHSIQARERLTAPERLARAARLTRAADIRRCLQVGRRRRFEYLEMIWADNSTGHPRLGLIVPKYGANAVARNRLRRRIKEVWRREVQPVQPDWDLIVRARREAYGQPFADLRHQLLAWRDAVITGR